MSGLETNQFGLFLLITKEPHQLLQLLLLQSELDVTSPQKSLGLLPKWLLLLATDHPALDALLNIIWQLLNQWATKEIDVSYLRCSSCPDTLDRLFFQT